MGWYLSGVFLTCIVACLLRLAPAVDHRPFHADEAVNALQLQAVLEGQPYRYDPVDRHGPTLVVAARSLAALLKVRSIAELSEWQLRLIPAAASLAFLALLALLHRDLGKHAVLAALAWLSLAAPFAYYGGVFIHESLLLLATAATFVAAVKFCRSESLVPALALGLSIGFLVSTKITFVLSVGAAATAGLLVWLTATQPAETPRAERIEAMKRTAPRLALVAAVSLATAATLFSWFGQHPDGIADAFRALSSASNRADGQGHAKPFLTYAEWFLTGNSRSLPWAGWLLCASFLPGAWLAWRRRRESPLQLGIALYTLILGGMYSLIPYKTPWLALQFMLPAALVGGVFIAYLINCANPIACAASWAALVVAASLLLHETNVLVRHFPSDPSNPLAYSPSSPDLADLPKRIAGARSGASNPIVHVYGEDYWPLPWYLRKFEQVGYFSEVPSPQTSPPPDVILLTGSARTLDLSALPSSASGRAWRQEFAGLRAETPMVLCLPEE